MNKVQCRGSLLLGSACLKCDKCLEELREYYLQTENFNKNISESAET